MKATITLRDPEEQHTVEIDAWCRLQFERNAGRHGLPPAPMRELAARFPESYIVICAYYAARRAGLVDGTYDAFEARWDGMVDADGSEDGPDGLPDPTVPAR